MNVFIPLIQNFNFSRKFFAMFFIGLLLNTGLVLSQPILQKPAMSASNLEASFLISIRAVTGATTYDIELSHDGSFTGTFPNYQSKIGTAPRSLMVSQLNYGATYFIRWKANNTGYGSTTVTVKASPVTFAQITSGVTYGNTNVNIVPKAQHGVTSFNWEFDTSINFDSPNLISATTSASSSSGRYVFVPTNFIANQLYYVRVRGIVSYQGLTGAWSTGSNIKNFNTSLRVAPVLNTPAMGATNLNASFSIGIGTVSGASTYDIEISLNGNFNDAFPDYQSSLASTSRTFAVSSLQYGQTYTIRWRANNSEYGTTTVTIKNLPETYPVNITEGQYLNIQNFGVQPSPQSGAVSYDWEFDTINTFSSPALITANTLASVNNGKYAYDADNFISGQLYYVRIRVNTISVTGPWSTGGNLRSFYSSLHLAQVSSPTDLYVANRISLKLECFVVNNATSYEIQYSTNSNFSGATTVIPNRDFYSPGGWNPIGEIVVKSYDYVSGLTFGTDYYVRARASNVNQASAWGPSIMFNTGGPNISITNPANGASNVQTTFTFSLTAAVWADAFAVETSLTPDFSSSVITTSTNSKVKVIGMNNGTSTYYARARVQVGGVWYTSVVAPISFTTCAACRQADVTALETSQVGASTHLNVYPNPSVDEFNLVNSYAERISVQVQDFSGKLLLEYRGDDPVISFGSQLLPGSYIVIIRDAEGQVETRKVVKY